MHPVPSLALRLACTAFAATLALLAASRYFALRGERMAQAAWLERSGVRVDPRLGRELAREMDPDGVRLRAVRASLASEMKLATSLDPATPEGRAELRRSAARLEETARLAGEVLARRPASWEAAMVLGGATWQGWVNARDSRLFTSPEQWEEPLLAARRLAPSKREPLRLLAAAYLQIWPGLSPAKRERTRLLIAELLRDPEDQKVFLDPWLATVADKQILISALPPDPQAWERVQKLFAGRGDWRAFRAAQVGWDRTLRAQLQNRLAAADDLIDQGDPLHARALYLSVIAEARPDLRDRDLIEEALTRCPPGPVGTERAERLSRLLEWAVERCRLAECPLSPAALKRLARLAGDPAPPLEAAALLLAGDLARAQSVERRAESEWGEAWVPYLLVKARTMAERGRAQEAAAALDLIPASWWRQPAYWLARRDVARAAGQTGAVLQAETRLRELAGREWPAWAWTWQRERARLEILADGPARGIDVAFDELPENGTVVEARVDGAVLGAFPALPARLLSLDLPLRPGLHLLEIDTVGGGRAVPGLVRLR
jgi:hypothetical protein